MVFMTLALAQVFLAFDARFRNRSIFTSRLFTNGWLWGAVMMCLVLQMAAVYLPLLQKVIQAVPPTISSGPSSLAVRCCRWWLSSLR